MARLSSLLAIVAFTYCHNFVSAHKGCGADRIPRRRIIQNMNSYPRMNSNHKDHSILEGRAQDPASANAAFEPIRIEFDTSQLSSDWTGYSRKDFFINDVFPAAEEWLEKVIKVRPVDGDLTLSRDCSSWYEQSPILKCVSGLPKSEGGNGGTPSNPSQCGSTGAIMPDSVLEAMHVCTQTQGQPLDCDTTTYPAGNGGYENTDLVIYVTGDADSDGTSNCANVMGFAAYCESNVYGRPIAGYINLCRDSIDSQIANGVLTWEESLALIIHETFHVLGFSTDGFTSFNTTEQVWTTDTLRGENRLIITLPTVIEKAEEFYGCSSIDGLELETYGISDFTKPTSHWDNRVVLNDFMISYVPLGPWYSPMTLAALADSGWYEINWEYAQHGTYGRNEGCTWFTKKCIVNGVAQFDEFCSSADLKSCGHAQIGKAYCPTVTYTSNLPGQQQYFSDPTLGGDTIYSDFCPIYKAYSNGDCRLWTDNDKEASDFDENGSNDLGGLISGTSKCIPLSGSSTNADSNFCTPVKCFKDSTGNYVGTRVSIFRSYIRNAVDSFTCWSDESGDKLNFDYAPASNKLFGFTKISCPDFDDLCYDLNPWICNGHGTIVDGSCVCSPGYMGSDCTIEANEVNRGLYTDADSLNVFIDEMCDGGFDYTGTEANIGILTITVTKIASATYNEVYFREALKNFVSILTMIPQCETDINDYNYNATDSSVTAEVWYFSSQTTWGDVTNANKVDVFEKLFGANPEYTLDVEKESEGNTLGGEVDSVSRIKCNIIIFTVIYCVLLANIFY